MAALDDIINQSFREEQQRLNNKKIKTGESKNVAKLFNEVQIIKTDCNICYETSTECIQCYQCDFKYCEECLSKVISEFNKCSACQANFKENYNQLKDKNKKHNKNYNHHNEKHYHHNTKPESTSSSVSTNNTDCDYKQDLLLSDYEIEQLTMLLQMENISQSSKSNQSNQSNRSSKSNQSNRSNQSSNTKNANMYLDNEFDDDIESCQFQAIKQNGLYWFNVLQNKDNNELIYLSNDDNLRPIIINYKLLDKNFQRTIFICLVELIDKPDTFPNVWQTMSSMIYNFTYNNYYLINNKNNNNQAFLYQKQDLMNTFYQMANCN